VSQKAYYLSLTLVGFFVLNGCMPSNYKPTKTGLELQSIQSKEFETTKQVAFASTISVFQDIGYIIESGDFDTGLITGKSPTKGGILFTYGPTQEYRKATGFVESLRSGNARVRLNFVDIFKVSSTSGMERRVDNPIEDPKFYQEIFDKIKKAIFVRSNVD